MSKPKSNIKIALILIPLVAIITALAVVVVYLQFSPTKRLDKKMELANKYLEEEDYEQAVAAFQAAIDIDPKCMDAYLGLADAYIGMDDKEQAAKAYEDAIKVDSKCLDAYLGLADVYYKMGESEKVEKTLDKAEKKFDDDKYKKEMKKIKQKRADLTDDTSAAGATTDTTSGGDSTTAANKSDNAILQDYMASLDVSALPKNQIVDVNCFMVEGEYNSINVEFDSSAYAGVINYICHDINGDGEDEVVTASKDPQGRIILSAYNVLDGQVHAMFTEYMRDSIESGAQGSYAKLCLCEKNGKCYVVWETMAYMNLTADGGHYAVDIFEINGNSLSKVYTSDLIGSEFYDIEMGEDATFNNNMKLLNDLGFTYSAAEYVNEFKMSEKDGLIPVSYVETRHSSQYGDFDYESIWRDGVNADAGIMSIVFSDNESNGRGCMDAEHPFKW